MADVYPIVVVEGGTGTGKTSVVRAFVAAYKDNSVGRLLLTSESNEAVLRMAESCKDQLGPDCLVYIPSRKMAKSNRIPTWLEACSIRQQRGLLLAALHRVFDAARDRNFSKVCVAFNSMIRLMLTDFRQFQV